MNDPAANPPPLTMVVAIKAQNTGNYFIQGLPYTHWTHLLDDATKFTSHDDLVAAIQEHRLSNIGVVPLMRVGDQWLPVVGAS